MLDDTKVQARKKTNKPAVGNGSVALYGRSDRLFFLTFRSHVDVSALLNRLVGCHELLRDEPLWGPDWVAIGYDKRSAEEAIQQSSASPENAKQQIVDEVFAAIWSGLYTGAVSGHELVTTPLPPCPVPEVDLGVMIFRQAQW